jgi:UDP-glucose 4-epimerase
MADLLLKEYPDLEVVGIDNFSTGQSENLREAIKTGRLEVLCADLLELHYDISSLKGIDTVFHFAANADIRNGPKNTSRDIEQNILVTSSLLEGMRMIGCKTILFTSTGPVYGETNTIPTPEDAPMGIQTSLYATSKLAAEGLISSYCEAFGFTSYLFRMVSLLGPRYSHGHVIDFVRQLKANPSILEVLGDGTARKSYLHVSDACRAIARVNHMGLANDPTYGAHRTAIFNLGLQEHICVADSARSIAKYMGLNPEIQFGEGTRGWIGDIPWIFLDTKKILTTGWKPAFTLQQALEDTVRNLL